MKVNVRIVQLGKGVLSYQADDGATIQDALESAGVPTATMEIRVGGRRVELTERLKDGDLVTAIPRIRGGQSPKASEG
jgi:sulfur carrier protein ThiS